MATIAQAVTVSIPGAANPAGADPVAVAPATLPVPESVGKASRAQDTVNLTETGGRNVAVAAPNGKAAVPAFQVAYFPPSSAPRAKASGTQTNSAQAAAAVPAQTNNPTAQVANAAAQEATSTSSSSAGSSAGAGANSSAAASQTSPLSAASQAKLQKLDQELQQMGINPAQVSFAARIALLPLINDPAAIQQYVQGLPAQSAVLNPATSQSNSTASLGTQAAASGLSIAASVNGSGSADRVAAGAAVIRGVNSLPSGNGSASFNPASASFAAAAGAGTTSGSDATGQKVNISV
jgi:hypothetical protein